MDTLVDYVRWYSDLSFTDKPFTIVDNLIFSALSYFRYPAFDWSAERSYSLKECYESLQESNKVKLLSTDVDPDYPSFMEICAHSHRYGQLQVSDYVDEFYPEVPIQFSAVQFHLPGSQIYLAYRGTDSSLAGWKEDFMISFTKTKAQEQALAYLENHMRPGYSYYVGGHSKGGNLVLYACALVSADRYNQINHIYINDGPGIAPEVDLRTRRTLKEKTTMIQPEFDIIGKLFEPDIPDTIIVKSSAKSFLQHSIFSWGVDHGRLFTTEAYDKLSVLLNRVIDRWIGTVSTEDRRQFTDDLFDALSANGCKSVFDVADKGPEAFRGIINSLRASDPATIETIKKIREAAVDESKEALSRAVTSITPPKYHHYLTSTENLIKKTAKNTYQLRHELANTWQKGSRILQHKSDNSENLKTYPVDNDEQTQ